MNLMIFKDDYMNNNSKKNLIHFCPDDRQLKTIIMPDLKLSNGNLITNFLYHPTTRRNLAIVFIF